MLCLTCDTPRLGPWPGASWARRASSNLPSQSISSCSAARSSALLIKRSAQHDCSVIRQCNARQQRRVAVARTSDFDVDEPRSEEAQSGEEQPLGPRDDDVLPADLMGAVVAAAEATAEALQRGVTRCEVELLLPEFWDPVSGPIFPNKGDQERFWRITRRFVEELSARAGSSARAVYPDAGVAAMLSHKWQDKTFSIGSLNDRKPAVASDELVVIACVDPPGADDCIKLVRTMAAQDEEAGALQRPVVMFNQRLSSGDVGLGLNARRLRSNFIKNFTVTYSLRPIGDFGTVFRRYPGLWQVFLEDPTLPGRYRKVAEESVRPQGEALDTLVQQVLSADGGGLSADGAERPPPGLFDQLRAAANSMQYFMKALTK